MAGTPPFWSRRDDHLGVFFFITTFFKINLSKKSKVGSRKTEFRRLKVKKLWAVRFELWAVGDE